jgi:hypothetical protein
MGVTLTADANLNNGVIYNNTPQQNLLTNGGFDSWDFGTTFTESNTMTANNWLLSRANTNGTITREGTTVDSGGYSLKWVLNTISNNFTWYVYNQLSDYWAYRGKTLSVSMRVNTSSASAIQVGIYDGFTTALSSFHSGGGGWETLTATLPISGSATQINVSVGVLSAHGAITNTTYVDSAMLTFGSIAMPYNPRVNYRSQILQVLQTTPTGGTSTTSTSFVTTGLNLNIIPKLSTSIIMVQVYGGINTSSSSFPGQATIVRNSSIQLPVGYGNTLASIRNGVTPILYPVSLTVFDTPLTQSSTNYAVHIKATSGGTTVWAGDGNQNFFGGMMVLTEIAPSFI